jgi:hypothetical protein
MIVSTPNIQENISPFLHSHPNVNCHNETNINVVDNFSYHVDLKTETLDNAMSEADEMEFIISSTHQKLRCLLYITPISLD